MSSTDQVSHELYTEHIRIIQFIQRKWPIKNISYDANNNALNLECDTMCFTISHTTYEVSTRIGTAYQQICVAISMHTFSRAIEEIATIQEISCTA